MAEKKGLFSLQIFFILANETKDNNRVFKKKHFHVIFGFFGRETHHGLRYKHKNVKFCMQSFFLNLYFSTNPNLQPKKGLKSFYVKALFLFMKKRHVIQFS